MRALSPYFICTAVHFTESETVYFILKPNLSYCRVIAIQNMSKSLSFRVLQKGPLTRPMIIISEITIIKSLYPSFCVCVISEGGLHKYADLGATKCWNCASKYLIGITARAATKPRSTQETLVLPHFFVQAYYYAAVNYHVLCRMQSVGIY